MRRRLLGFAALAALAGCQPPAPLAVVRIDPRIILTPAVAELNVAEPRISTGPDGRLRVGLEVGNPTGVDYPLRLQTDWLDASGRPLNTLQSRPVFRSLARHSVTTLSADAPGPQARDFRITLDLEPSGR